MRFASVALGFALAASAAAAEVDPAWVERAKKEGAVTLYTSMQLTDSRPLAEAFEKKHGIKVSLWRASGEKVAQRVITEARGGRFDVDVRASEVPGSYEDLLDPKWVGRFALEAADVAWFAAVANAMGEDKAVAFRKLAAMKPSIRSGHTLMVELVAAGEIDMALDAHVQGVARLKDKGAPIEWKAQQPAFGQPSSVGVARRAPHPNAALLFAGFVLSREGQEVIKSRNRVPSSRAIDSPLNKFRYELVDPALMLDEWDKWSKLRSALFLGGKELKKDA